MLIACYKNKFQKDVKRANKRGYNLKKLKLVMDTLIEGKSLPKKFVDHPLKGDFSICRECHIEPDWILIYYVEGNEITFVRTGTHSDLFK